jgi:hypothetical protein
MKRVGTIIGLLLLLLIAGSGCHYARHDRGIKDSVKMIRMRMGQKRMGRKGQFMEHFPMHGMRGGMGQGMRNGMMRGMGHGMGFGMMRGMGQMPIDSIGWMPMGPGTRMLESIPNVTENQKKQIEDLIKKQQDEMKKLREEMSAKMKILMDSHRKNVLDILTDEQKKFIESRSGNTSPSPEKIK